MKSAFAPNYDDLSVTGHPLPAKKKAITRRLRMMASGKCAFTLGLGHPQLFDRHRGDAGHRNDDGDKGAEDWPTHHVREVFSGAGVIMSNEFSLRIHYIL
jgi:hypothetical protein